MIYFQLNKTKPTVANGKQISRKDALELASSILINAEKERIEAADKEARIGLQYSEEETVILEVDGV
jgi:hypothetical protein